MKGRSKERKRKSWREQIFMEFEDIGKMFGLGRKHEIQPNKARYDLYFTLLRTE